MSGRDVTLRIYAEAKDKATRESLPGVRYIKGDKTAMGDVMATLKSMDEDKIEELFLISFVPDPKNAKGWLISPEMKDRPVITPLAGKEGAAKGDAK